MLDHGGNRIDVGPKDRDADAVTAIAKRQPDVFGAGHKGFRMGVGQLDAASRPEPGLREQLEAQLAVILVVRIGAADRLGAFDCGEPAAKVARSAKGQLVVEDRARDDARDLGSPRTCSIVTSC